MGFEKPNTPEEETKLVRLGDRIARSYDELDISEIDRFGARMSVKGDPEHVALDRILFKTEDGKEFAISEVGEKYEDSPLNKAISQAQFENLKKEGAEYVLMDFHPEGGSNLRIYGLTDESMQDTLRVGEPYDRLKTGNIELILGADTTQSYTEKELEELTSEGKIEDPGPGEPTVEDALRLLGKSLGKTIEDVAKAREKEK